MSTSVEDRVDVWNVVDQSKVGELQIGVIILCALCIMTGGFSIQALGFALPTIRGEFRIAASSLSPIVNAVPWGLLLGGILCGIGADKLGRRPVLLIGAFLLSTSTILTGFSSSPQELRIVRTIASIALGSIIPTALALVYEYMPMRFRLAMTTIVAASYTAGAVISGYVAVPLNSSLGWRSVFYLGGVVLLLVTLVMLFCLPESLPLSVLSGKGSSAAVRRTLARIDRRTFASNKDFVVTGEETGRAVPPLLNIFLGGRFLATVLFWTVNFTILLSLYFLFSYMPLFLSRNGIALSDLVRITSYSPIGGILGAIVLGWLIGRFSFTLVLTTGLIIACVSMGLVAVTQLSVSALMVAVFLAGFGIVGVQSAVTAWIASFYPTSLRATGIGTSLGIARASSFVGTEIANGLSNGGYSAALIFSLGAASALISVLVVTGLKWAVKNVPRQMKGQSLQPHISTRTHTDIIALGAVGGLLGAIIGFFLRPSVPFVGQLPFSAVITRGAGLKGLDTLLISVAETSFEYVLVGLITGAAVGMLAAYLRQAQNVWPAAGTTDSPRSSSREDTATEVRFPPAASNEAHRTPTVELGQTRDLVETVLGRPEKIVDLGSKTLYVYKDLKLTFIDGKVVDVQ